MFVPNGYQFESEAEKIAFMQRYSFATIITNNDQQIPLATQLPFVIDQHSGKLILSAHFSIANEQAKYIEQHTSLIIFTEPHAYISPTHYTKHESVPTWDYIAVHAYGKASLITDEALKLKALEQMINFYEKGYLAQWNSLTDTFKSRMIKGIVAFELEVTDLQGQKKLSQNKSQAERESIIAHLEKSNNTVEHDLAGYIQKTLNDKAK
ncbi:FMN-binding negative transcriptional regulator [Pedobacter sp. HDW13]|uniref:FMN-binding negative transcriptional regulator n=1 Tax=unclassified Pedobacter TaxID=2628915 RepID=UPI000F5B3033|nr:MULTISPECIES: FMN-binding negative transcriptional regulator [unclassified Pedobacter]QIL38239.1 FMN-binding negative transcriptional regulator [Pedobacter sp. HDW13]RQO73674.1 FMN-binding negative transcriptional regulator [Pedobacter sp. KBW01]